MRAIENLTLQVAADNEKAYTALSETFNREVPRGISLRQAMLVGTAVEKVLNSISRLGDSLAQISKGE
jgi:hypothetical protein